MDILVEADADAAGKEIGRGAMETAGVGAFGCAPATEDMAGLKRHLNTILAGLLVIGIGSSALALGAWLMWLSQ